MLQEWMAQTAEREQLDHVVDRWVGRLKPVLARERVHWLLSGHWLGHRVHPAATDVVIGAWTSAALLDLSGDRFARAAQALVGAGVAAAVPTVLTGTSDWLETDRRVQRVGLLHAVGNQTALALQIGSWVARRRGAHGVGRACSGAAMVAAGLSAWIGGHMTYSQGAGVEA